MSTYQLFLWLSVFVATAVEMVEALTIVLALGVTRGWRSVLLATGLALLTLVITVAVLSAVLSQITDESMIPIGPLWAVVGGLLLIFGLQWTKKAILRIGGILPSRDEDKIYKKVRADAKKASSFVGSIDWYSFTVAFKGVLLEGFEVVFIVIVFGSTRGEFGLGVTAAVSALVFIGLLGVFIHRPLSRVPENWMKLFVGLFLVTFGTYFASDGVGIRWPFGEWALLYLLVLYSVFALFAIRILKSGQKA